MNPPVCYLTLVSSTLFYLSNIRSSKKLVSTCWSVLTDFCHYLHLLLIDSFLGSFWEIELFEGVATIACVLVKSFAVCRGIADEYAMEGSSKCEFRDVGEGGRLTGMR